MKNFEAEKIKYKVLASILTITIFMVGYYTSVNAQEESIPTEETPVEESVPEEAPESTEETIPDSTQDNSEEIPDPIEEETPVEEIEQTTKETPNPETTQTEEPPIEPIEEAIADPVPDPILGCTNQSAVNFDELANTDDETCIIEIPGCMITTAENYDPIATIANGSCILDEDEESSIESEIGLEAILVEDSQENSEEETSDEYNSGEEILGESTEDGDIKETVESIPDPILGCTNPSSINFDELANTDDESCIVEIPGCTLIEAENYDPIATIANGSCVFDEERELDPQINPIDNSRILGRKITVDEKAKHYCEVEPFNVDLKDASESITVLSISSGASFKGTLEVGSLPKGIDIKIIKDNESNYKQTINNESYFTLEITEGIDSQKGSFSLPIIYTIKNYLFKDSVSICQIGINNL